MRRLATEFDAAKASPQLLSDSEIGALTHEYDLHATFARDAESHRSTAMTFILTAVAAIVYALAAAKFDPRYWPLALVAGLLGLYATTLAGIYHER